MQKIHAPYSENLNSTNNEFDNQEKLILNTFQDKTDNITELLKDMREELYDDASVIFPAEVDVKEKICIQLVHGTFAGTVGMRDRFHSYLIIDFDDILTEPLSISVIFM